MQLLRILPSILTLNLAVADSPMDATVLNVTSAAVAETDVPELDLSLTAPTRDVTASVICIAAFGPLEFSWVDGPFDLAASTSVPVVLSIPGEAFLHPLADTYVTDLGCKVEITEADGRRGQGASLPELYIIWPNGESGDPVVWNFEDLKYYAPVGCIDPSAVASLDAAAEPGLVRMSPPIWHEVASRRPSMDEVTLDRETVPVDDQTDELLHDLEVAP